jgi:hypothetical protein
VLGLFSLEEEFASAQVLSIIKGDEDKAVLE